jgi:effector-binding domain-containing protein
MLDHIKVIILLTCLLTVSCGNSKKQNQNNSEKLDGNKTVLVKPEKDYEKIGTDILNSETIGTLKYGLSYSELINELGEPSEKLESELWGADGEYHQTIKYSTQGIELDIIGEVDAEKRINMITIYDPCDLKTLKNIGVGSSFDQVESAYKGLIDWINSDKSQIVVGSLYGGMMFKFKDQKVNSIFMGSVAE